MTIARKAIHGLAAAGAVALLASVAVAAESAEEKAAHTRQGFMDLIVWEAGPLFAMAKGDRPYDADQATSHAQNLAALAEYPVHQLFLPDSSNADLPGKTAALPAIWEDPDKFRQGFTNLQDRAAVVVAEAGKGPDELRAAVGDLGKACGNCHETFREKK